MAKRLVCPLVLAGCLLPGASVAHSQPPGASARDLVVHAASYVHGGDVCDGDTHPVQIRIEPNPAKRIQVGFFESSASAIGPQWRAAGWMAAFVATTMLGEDLHSLRVAYTLEGRIDGPSAGALTTGGLLALIRRQPVLQDVSMTGTINPDGTVGPVGGIPQKVRGAASSGMKRFAVPLGQRRDQNICTGNEEDVVALGRSLGVEVVEVGDVRDVYAFLTGGTLPAATAQPVSSDLPRDIRTAFQKLAERWMTRYEAAQQVVAGAQGSEFTPELRSIWQVGERLVQAGQDELRSGHEAAGFNRIWVGVLSAQVAARGVVGMRALLGRGLPGLHAEAQSQIARIRKRVDEDGKAFHGIAVATPVDAGTVALIGGNMAAAFAYLQQADTLWRRSMDLSRQARPDTGVEVALLAFEALGHATLAESLADVAVDTKGWLGRGGPALPSGPNADDATESALALYRSAALSNLEYFDALVTAAIAKSEGVDLATAGNALRRTDPVYLAARGALEQLGTLRQLFGPGRAGIFAQLGALTLTVSNSSLLVAQHYSLDVQRDKLGRIVGVGREAALTRMTEMADQEALRAIGQAAAATGGASTPLLAATLDAARRNRDVSVTVQDRLTALSLYWNATVTARLITQLSGRR